jgi:Mg-chelatase subunit ChlI-like protein
MLYKTLSAAVYGIDASIIEVEVDVSGIKTNEDYFHTVGSPDAAVRESRERVRAALKNCGYDIPATHITINLAPADIRKEGSGFDLPMALGILGAARSDHPNPPFDHPPLTCYKSWFCIGPPGSNRRPLRYETSDAAKLNTPVQSRVVEACSELRQCAPRRS